MGHDDDRRLEERLDKIEEQLKLLIKLTLQERHEIEEIESALKPHSYPRTNGMVVRGFRFMP
jgi:hypothetical protein